MAKAIYVSCLFMLLTACSFDNALCGELDEKLKTRIGNVEKSYGDVLRVNPIPCEFNYIRIELKTDDYNDSILDSVHKMLLDKKTMEGWTTLYIYDKNNKYLFSHSSNNQKYKQTGD